MNPFFFDKQLYKYRTFEDAMKILENESIMFSSPNSFNDPFDCSNRLLDLSFSTRLSYQYVEKLVNGDPQYTRKQRRLMKKTSGNPSGMLNMSKSSTTKMRELQGIFCASEICDSTLMWSHYADNHKGVCIGFEFPEDLKQLADLRTLLPLYVNYLDSFKKAPFIEETNMQMSPETIVHWFCTKATVWNYEREVRFIKLLPGLVKIKRTFIRKVIFGLQTPEENKKKIKTVLRQKFGHVKVEQMEFKPNSFLLSAEPV